MFPLLFKQNIETSRRLIVLKIEIAKTITKPDNMMKMILERNILTGINITLSINICKKKALRLLNRSVNPGISVSFLSVK